MLPVSEYQDWQDFFEQQNKDREKAEKKAARRNRRGR